MSATVKGLLVTPDGERRYVEVEPTLEVLSSIVGGPIEYVFVTNGVHAYLHEEGKLVGLPANPEATRLAGYLGVDMFVGSVIFLGDDGEGGEADLPEQWLNL